MKKLIIDNFIYGSIFLFPDIGNEKEKLSCEFNEPVKPEGSGEPNNWTIYT